MDDLAKYKEQTEAMIWDLMALTHPSRLVVQSWLETTADTLPELVRRTLYAFQADKPTEALDGYLLNFYKLKDAADFYETHEIWPATFPARWT